MTKQTPTGVLMSRLGQLHSTYETEYPEVPDGI